MSLGRLHQYKVMHMDITPENIMFSRRLNKPVFIDFGFSNIIPQMCGFKTYTEFKGTPQYSSKEMLKLFSVESKWDYVDLYYNDLHCLQKSFQKIE
jgi:serine/threonine protein kinase